MKPTKKEKATGALARALKNRDQLALRQTENRMMLAAKIYDAMLARGMKQKDLAKAMGCTTSEISDWLSGDRNFTADTLSKFEVILNVRLFNASTTRRRTSHAHTAISATTI